MVPQGITCVVLHVPNKDIVPIHQKQRTVRCELHIDRSKIAICSLHEILAMATYITCSVVFQHMLLHAKEADGVIDQEITLDLVRKVAAGDEFEARRRPNAMGVFNQVVGFVSRKSIAGLDGARHHPPDVRS